MLIVPWCASIRRLTVGRPRPDPRTLVVKNGVKIFPVWNGAMPALLKGFFEQTFRPAFIFPDMKPGEQLGFSSYFRQRKALTGKTARVITTMQMAAFVYRWYFHPHPEKNALRLSGLGPIRETLIGLVEASDGRRRASWLKKVHALGHNAR
jgi:putative NADPH-quinone reductase